MNTALVTTAANRAINKARDADAALAAPIPAGVRVGDPRYYAAQLERRVANGRARLAELKAILEGDARTPGLRPQLAAVVDALDRAERRIETMRTEAAAAEQAAASRLGDARADAARRRAALEEANAVVLANSVRLAGDNAALKRDLDAARAEATTLKSQRNEQQARAVAAEAEAARLRAELRAVQQGARAAPTPGATRTADDELAVRAAAEAERARAADLAAQLDAARTRNEALAAELAQARAAAEPAGEALRVERDAARAAEAEVKAAFDRLTAEVKARSDEGGMGWVLGAGAFGLGLALGRGSRG